MQGGGDDRDSSAAATVARLPAGRWASITFLALFLMNLLDYVDRWVLAAVLPDVQRSLDLSNAQAGKLATVFLISYSIFSLFTGYAGDRFRRTYLLALGVGVWSLATVGTGFARTYDDVWYARSVLGIGEATYGVIAPTVLMDLFGRERRARVLSAFYLAMPIGGALGMVLGAWMAKHYGWHSAFLLVGAPGLVVALLALLLPEPPRGASEGVAAARLHQHQKAGPRQADYVELMVNSSYNYAVFGLTFYTFAIGGLAYWLPSFLVKARGIESVAANKYLAVTTLIAAIVGMTTGGWLADRLTRVSPRALFQVPGVAMLAAVPFMVLALFARSTPLIYLGILMAEMLMFVNTGPCNAVIANVVMPQMRATAYAVAVFVQHALGDIWSPWLMGKVADSFGKPDTMATSLGRALAGLGATPVVSGAGGRPENLLAGMLVVVPAVLVSGLVLLAGARHLPREMALMTARLRAVPESPRTRS